MSAVYSKYKKLVDSGELEANEWQYKMAARFDELAAQLGPLDNPSFFKQLFTPKKPVPRGLYLYGSVGRGKTMLMDIFFDSLPRTDKLRTNFNEFMAEAQQKLNYHRAQIVAGKTKEKDPMQLVAKELRQQFSILCFDEFTVTDIADATILARLFQKLFHLGIVLVATSNVAPADLYKNGINRELFLPFIPLLEQNCDIVNATVNKDFRMGKEQDPGHYIYPASEVNTRRLTQKWKELTAGQPLDSRELIVAGHKFKPLLSCCNMCFFEFEQLCGTALSAADYSALSVQYNIVFLAKIPYLDDELRNWAKRFIILIDILYENNIKLYATAAASPLELYIGLRDGVEKFEYARTASRLIEMQSADYLNSWQEKYSEKA